MSKIFEQGKNELVIHQDVARMRGTLTSIQSKGMNSILKRSFEQLQNNRTRTKFVFDTDTLLEDMQLDYKMGKKSKIETIYKPLDELSNKKFIWGTDKKINQAVFMQEFEITDETVTIVFSNYIRNKLEVINNALIINDFVTLQSFKSVYAERLYKQIQMWKDKGELILSVKDFKDFLGVPKSSAYTRMTNMKTKVLKVAIKEINEKSNFELHYEDIKKGRSITHFKFLWLYHDPAKYEKMEIDKRKREIKKLLNKYVRLRNGEKYKIVKYKIFDYESEDIGVITLQDIGGGSIKVHYRHIDEVKKFLIENETAETKLYFTDLKNQEMQEAIDKLKKLTEKKKMI